MSYQNGITKKDRMQTDPSGLFSLVTFLAEGPQIVRELLRDGDPHLALAQATWLQQLGHPQGQELVEEAEAVIKGQVVRA